MYNASKTETMKQESLTRRVAAKQPADVLAEKARELLTSTRTAMGALIALLAVVVMYQTDITGKHVTMAVALVASLVLAAYATIDIRKGGCDE